MDEREDTLICTDHEGGNRQDAWRSGLGGGRKGAQMSLELKLGRRHRLRHLRRARPNRGHLAASGDDGRGVIHGPQRSPQKMSMSTSMTSGGDGGGVHGYRRSPWTSTWWCCVALARRRRGGWGSGWGGTEKSLWMGKWRRCVVGGGGGGAAERAWQTRFFSFLRDADARDSRAGASRRRTRGLTRSKTT
jgi:hypothetical protein